MTDARLRAKVALAELDAMGISIADLLAVAGTSKTSRPAPTFAEYVPVVSERYRARSLRTYGSYWRFAAQFLGDKPIDQVTTDDLAKVLVEVRTRAMTNRAGSDGRSSQEHCVAAFRALFAQAQRAGLVPVNPALLIDKPRRARNRRRALTEHELRDVWDAVRTVSRDPALDLVLIRFHLESGARRAGAIRLRLRDLDETRSTVWLKEKFDDEREQPISPTLLGALDRLARERGSTGPEDPIFRKARRAGLHPPLTDRHYDRLFLKLQREVPWALNTPLTPHVLRHTAVTAVERVAGFAVAQKFAGHAGSSVTSTYVKADVSEVAAAVAVLSGESHPLASFVGFTPTTAS